MLKIFFLMRHFCKNWKTSGWKINFLNLFEAPFTHVLVFSAFFLFLSFWRNIIFMFALFSFPGRQLIPFLLLLTFPLLPAGIFRLTGLHGYFQIPFTHFLFQLCTEDLILSKNSVPFLPFILHVPFFFIFFRMARNIY